ncbi:MAG: DUF2158 domain-containing protein [Parvibaculum sp.]
MTEILTGRVGRLKSGGPLMTVTSVQGPAANCPRFDKTKLMAGRFAVATPNVIKGDKE